MVEEEEEEAGFFEYGSNPPQLSLEDDDSVSSTKPRAKGNESALSRGDEDRDGWTHSALETFLLEG